MKIGHRFELVDGDFDTATGELICIAKKKYMEVGQMAGHYCDSHGKNSLQCKTANEIQEQLHWDWREQEKKNEWRRKGW